ncbi:pyridine nucleotide-disulfide oxidoreductase [Agrobacterium vitis]|uniref:Pyridine nucleotide-disulfide oxidoreductase n=1 Tax=Agrobacterium vitis TaxID=373 RepID=A0A7K1RFA8_AGRVI|nr:FAD-dependent oxidoreductase [Agrobacterium vitis]MUO80878.1 pyridine nucleotide-disulfide oxidoreductase [Agrobacterium vitis]MUO94786.1 pyridine nucleotide-disulfide oxidoreductase [Agrobacterium vitis]MUP05452.1 pyridine nucleotide-disulfide oxidoreductase [Agrobacterium vitis]MUZ81554.1 pyridine nucleotide-disulfide oxidoreductase [Agrobacterium vitis]MVA56698.1 pyridine nucleotide-disulfide oxidoreductase [Agrobacterium vitis]
MDRDQQTSLSRNACDQHAPAAACRCRRTQEGDGPVTVPRYHVAIVGAGPSGFYAAEALLRSDKNIAVDLFERLPVPYGLVRFGVAPDHPKLKQVTAVFERIAQMPGFRFIGGVEIGVDTNITDLRRSYHAVILATGAALGREIGLPGENLPGTHQASDFVGWYNGHPDCRDLTFDFGGERAVVIGHGNVALDVARILVKTPEELRHTDIAGHALEMLAESRIREVHLVGRGAPAGIRFSAKELHEFGTLENCDPGVEMGDLAIDPFASPEGVDPERKTAIGLIDAFSRRKWEKSKRCLFRFHLTPVCFEGHERVSRAVFRWGATGKGMEQDVTIDTNLVFLSVGRRSAPVTDVPYDADRGVHANAGGRIWAEDGLVLGLYACGWSKRGPQGTIGTNRACAIDTVEKVLADLDSLPLPDPAAADSFVSSIWDRQGLRLDFDAWRAIDTAEVARGRSLGKPREKFVSVEAMIAAAGGKDIAC